MVESLGGQGPAVSLWLKPKAAPKNGGTEDWRTVADSLTRHRPEAWQISPRIGEAKDLQAARELSSCNHERV